MRRFALLLGVTLPLVCTSAVAQDCDNFTDVPASSSFCPDVTWIAQHNITKGCGGSQFCPNESVTRLQMAAFMHRLGENPAFVNGGNAFGAQALLGTSDYNSLNVIVNGQRAMTVQPAGDAQLGFNPNVVNGMFFNSVAPSIAGATIAGGGGCNPGTGGSCTQAFGNHVGAEFGTVGGGSANTTSGYGATVGGGQNNTASGDTSTVPGGNGNTAGGVNSFAAGSNANATDDSSFVWGDGSQAANSTGTASFSVLATGGIGLYPGGATVGVYDGGWSCTVSNGSANWVCSSDRNLKENFQTLDVRDVLQRVVAMPVTSWTFIGHSDRRHIGPVAQDFHASFGLGDAKDDTHIDIGDSQGVALAAIQGLNAKLDEQTARLESAVQGKSRQLEEQAATIRDQQRQIVELREQVQYTRNLAADIEALKSALAELQRGPETIAAK
jgi:hypothetical protein